MAAHGSRCAPCGSALLSPRAIPGRELERRGIRPGVDEQPLERNRVPGAQPICPTMMSIRVRKSAEPQAKAKERHMNRLDDSTADESARLLCGDDGPLYRGVPPFLAVSQGLGEGMFSLLVEVAQGAVAGGQACRVWQVDRRPPVAYYSLLQPYCRVSRLAVTCCPRKGAPMADPRARLARIRDGLNRRSGPGRGPWRR